MEIDLTKEPNEIAFSLKQKIGYTTFKKDYGTLEEDVAIQVSIIAVKLALQCCAKKEIVMNDDYSGLSHTKEYLKLTEVLIILETQLT